jgi:hypothetical protein
MIRKLLSRLFPRPSQPNNANVKKVYEKLREELAETRDERKALHELMPDIAIRKAESEERLKSIKELRFAEALCLMPDRECRELAGPLIAKYGSAESESAALTEKVFKERLWELELALEDRGWVRETTLAALEFSRYGVQQLIRICRIYGIKNPIIKRISEICELYVFGRGIEIRSEDDVANDVIHDFLKMNDAEMGHNGLASKEKDIQTDGALYFGLATDNQGNVRVIMVDPLEIMDVVTDPDDSAKPLYFKRQWNRNDFDPDSGIQAAFMMHCWYPSLELINDPPKVKLKSIGGYPVNWDMPILRDKIGSPAKWRWGVPPVYAAVDWARAYKDALEDYATVRRTLARFALMVDTKGGPGAIAAYQALFSTTFADADGTQIERNPPPVVASAHISGPGTNINAFKSAGAQANPEETRRILLMACASAGMPETFFGDASTGSLATAVSLDRPTELKFTAIQRRWGHTIKRILEYVIAVSRSTPGGKMREAFKKRGWLREGRVIVSVNIKGVYEANFTAKPKDVHIMVKFPNVVEHEMLPMIQSIMEIGTGGGRNGIFAGILDRRTIVDLALAEIGYEDRSKLLDQIFGKKYDPADDVTDQRSQVPPQSLMLPSGKALTSLSIPPPLPPPPPPPPAPVDPMAPKPPLVPTPKPAGPPLVPAKPGAAKPAAKPSPAKAKKEAVRLAVRAALSTIAKD